MRKGSASDKVKCAGHLGTATNKVALFRMERRIYPAGHPIIRACCRMNAAFRRCVQVPPKMRRAGRQFGLIALKANEIGTETSSILVDFFAKYGWLWPRRPR
jgi:hypothetical protein